MNKKIFWFPLAGIGISAIVSVYFQQKKEGNSIKKVFSKPKFVRNLRIPSVKNSSVKISRSLQKVLNNIENDRLIFVEIATINKIVRENVLKQLESLKTETPVDEIWIADFYKQSYSRDDIIVLANKKAIYYLTGIEGVEKAGISARTKMAKILGDSLSKLSIKYPSMEKYIFEPIMDIYAPLKESEELSNFGEVKDGVLYRGGMPVGDNYNQLIKNKIKTVINLKIEDSAVEYVNEQSNLHKRDINLEYLPLPNIAPPSMIQAMEFLNLVYNSEMQPVFIHCHRGADRTGVMAAIFRITQGYSASWALVEAEKFDIKSSFFNKKIEFVYEFEKKWNAWKNEGLIPENLNNFDFLSLIDSEEENTESRNQEEEEINYDNENN